MMGTKKEIDHCSTGYRQLGTEAGTLLRLMS